MTPFIQRVTSWSRRLSRGSAARSSGPASSAHDLDRHRGDVVVGGHRLRRPTVAPVDRARPPSGCPRPARRGGARRPAPRGAPPTGRSRRRWSGPSSTRSARPPARVRSKSSCSRIEPPVRALISRARAATSVRVSPSARNFWNAGERWSASTNATSSAAPTARAAARRSWSAASAAGRGTTPCPAAGRRAASRPRAGSA